MGETWKCTPQKRDVVNAILRLDEMGVAGGNGPMRRVTEDVKRLKTGRRHSFPHSPKYRKLMKKITILAFAEPRACP
jgi:hypothetical protein